MVVEMVMGVLGLFSHESKVRNLNDHSKDSILDRMYTKLHCDA